MDEAMRCKMLLKGAIYTMDYTDHREELRALDDTLELTSTSISAA